MLSPAFAVNVALVASQWQHRVWIVPLHLPINAESKAGKYRFSCVLCDPTGDRTLPTGFGGSCWWVGFDSWSCHNKHMKVVQILLLRYPLDMHDCHFATWSLFKPIAAVVHVQGLANSTARHILKPRSPAFVKLRATSWIPINAKSYQFDNALAELKICSIHL